MVAKKKSVKPKAPTILEHGLGYIPDQRDERDFLYSVHRPQTDMLQVTLPPAVTLIADFPDVYDQGQLGSCVGQSTALVFNFVLREQKVEVFSPARQFIYYNARLMLGTVQSDSGCMIRDAMKVLGNTGVPTEEVWPYSSRFNQRPSAAAYANAKALHHQALQYQRLNRSIEEFKVALFNRHPIVLGFSVYENFYQPWVQRFVAPLPSGRLLGGHAVTVIGYDDLLKGFLIQNSWGSRWGNAGRFVLPYEFVTNPGLSADFWTLLQV